MYGLGHSLRSAISCQRKELKLRDFERVLTNIGKTGVISESLILTSEDGPSDDEDVDGSSDFHDPRKHRSTTLSKSLDV